MKFLSANRSWYRIWRKDGSQGADVVKVLFKMGVMATINQVIDHDTAVLVVESSATRQ